MTMTTIVDESLLFGNVNASVSDKVSASIDQRLNAAVSNLPLMNAARCSALHARLLRAYWRNVDVMEVYTARNVFGLQRYSAARRKEIIETFLSVEDTAQLERDDAMEVENMDTPQCNDASEYPPLSEIPSDEDVSTLKDETKKLKEQIEALTKHKNELLRRGKELEVAQQLAQMVNIKAENLQETVNATVSAGQGLKVLQNQGKDILGKLEHTKHGRNDDDEDTTTELLTVQKVGKLMSIEERYEQDRQVLNSNLENVQNLRNWLTKQA